MFACASPLHRPATLRAVSDGGGLERFVFGADRFRAARDIQTPLGFFALCLLIVEGFLVGAGTLFGLSEGFKVAVLAVGVILFLAVAASVWALVWWRPKNLVFNAQSHLDREYIRLWGTKSQPLTTGSLDVLPAIPPPEPLPAQLPPPQQEIVQ